MIADKDLSRAVQLIAEILSSGRKRTEAQTAAIKRSQQREAHAVDMRTGKHKPHPYRPRKILPSLRRSTFEEAEVFLPEQPLPEATPAAPQSSTVDPKPLDASQPPN